MLFILYNCIYSIPIIENILHLYIYNNNNKSNMSEKSCGDVINIMHSHHLFELTGEVSCYSEQNCTFYVQ